MVSWICSLFYQRSGGHGRKGRETETSKCVSHFEKHVSHRKHSQGHTLDLFLKETQRGKQHVGNERRHKASSVFSTGLFIYGPNLKKSHPKQCGNWLLDKSCSCEFGLCAEKNEEIKVTMWKKIFKFKPKKKAADGLNKSLWLCSALLTKNLSNSGSTSTEMVNGRSVLAPTVLLRKDLSSGMKRRWRSFIFLSIETHTNNIYISRAGKLSMCS